MRITYRQLQVYISHLHPEQLNSDVTVEIEGEAYAADFRIVDDENEVGLEVNHPVIYVSGDESERSNDTEVLKHIELINKAGGFGPLTE